MRKGSLAGCWTQIPLHTTHKKFRNTNNDTKYVVYIKFYDWYIENQPLQAVEILDYFILHGPLKMQHMVRNNKAVVPMALRNTTAWFRPSFNGSEI